MKLVRLGARVALLVLPLIAAAQVYLYPKQNVNGPVPTYRQDVFPYPGQCTSNPANANLVSTTIPACSTISAAAGYRTAPAIATGTVKPLDPRLQPKFQWEVPNPLDFVPDRTRYQDVPGKPVDYYEISISAVKNGQAAADLGVFPNPKTAPGGPFPSIPDGYQWTGIVNPVTKQPLYTQAWGFGQINNQGGPLADLAHKLLGTPVGDNINPVVVTWPSMNLRGTKGRPMIVKFVNQLPDQHLFCPYPLAWDWPCAIDRTLMGTKATVDPIRGSASVPSDQVNKFGSPQQPDNAFTIHFHGGEIPPQSDGFAEKWFGNANSGQAYSPNATFLDPMFEAPSGTIGTILRPGGTGEFSAYDRMTYYYPMVNDESLLWYHDHALGKTRINVAAGPAGFAPVEDAAQHLANGPYAWLNPLAVKDPTTGIPLYDHFLAIQDRSFNNDGTINYPSGLGQPVPAAPPPPPGMTPVTIGNNPQVHPQWVGEYFADHVTVNGVIWPKMTVNRGTYRLRLLDGSNARCYQLGLSTKLPNFATAQNAGNVKNDTPFTVIANEQGYLPAPVTIPVGGFLQMCPGERYEILVDFSAMLPGTSIYMTNQAPAPFPVGISPQQRGSIFSEMAVIMRFDVSTAAGVTVVPPVNTNPLFTNVKALPMCPAGQTGNCISAVRQLYLNERIDPVTLTSLGLQINGVPFEYKVTETPKKGTFERWDIINTTGDFHPMHLHLVKFQTIQRQAFSINGFTSALCGSNNCQIFGGGAGGMMQVVPDVTPFLAPTTIRPPNPEEAGWKDTVQAPPGQVTSVIAKWDGSWTGADGTCPTTSGKMNFPGVGDYDRTATYDPTQALCFESVTNAPYVWHCHIVDHEDAEMMRSSLVVK